MLLNSLSQVPALQLVDFFHFIIDFIATNYLKDVFFYTMLFNVTTNNRKTKYCDICHVMLVPLCFKEL